MDDMTVEKRWFVIALVGGEAGAALGLLLFGGIIGAPILTALLGSFGAPLAVYARERWLAALTAPPATPAAPAEPVTSS